MIACYDLARCPPTYDAVAFLALAERERLRRGADHLDVRVLPGPLSGFRADGFGTWPHTAEGRALVRDEVLLPLCRLLPSVRSAQLACSRQEHAGEWGFNENLIGLPRIVEALKAGCRPLRATPSTRAAGLVTITLREAAHHPLRNSNLEEWVAAALELRAEGWDVVVVRDTARAYERLAGLRTDSGASVNLGARARLYARAALNVGVCNGPVWMSIFMGAPTLMIRPVTDAAGGCYDSAFYARFGLPRGSQLPTSPAHQRMVWEEDRREVIVDAVRKMLEEVETDVGPE